MNAGARAFVLIGLLIGWMAPATAATADFSISVDTSGGTDHYVWAISTEGGKAQADPTLYLQWGRTYTFQFVYTGSGYPFWVEEYGLGPYPVGPDAVTQETGLQQNPVLATLLKTITFEPRSDQPDSFYYICGNYREMAGPIRMVIFKAGFD